MTGDAMFNMESKDSVKVIDLVEPAYQVPPEMLIQDVKKTIGEDRPISSIVVVKDNKPLGLVMTLHMDRMLGQRYGYAIYHNKSVSSIMDSAPLIVRGSAPLTQVADLAMNRDKSKTYDHIIVTMDGLLVGVVTIQDMLQALAAMQNKRNEEILSANRQLQEAKKRAEKMNIEIRHAYDRLQEVDQLKTDFLSMVSHELRTPLTSILGFATMIQERLDNVIFPNTDTEKKKVQRSVGKVERNIGIIVGEAERLTALINDVLDIAKMEAGKIEWKKKPVDIHDIINRAAASTHALFENKSYSLTVDVEKGLPHFMGDRDRLIQVVINLLSNAVKFTDEGGVTLQAFKRGEGVVVSVEDRGIGISKEGQRQVFEKFRQVGDTLTDKPAGTGLGLPICKQIVESHGGRIWVESIPGEGSTFSFYLPFEVEEEKRTDRLGAMDTLKWRITDGLRNVDTSEGGPDMDAVLIVSPNAEARQEVRSQLAERGYTVREASDGKEALASVREAPPGMVILDRGIPLMNEHEVAHALKQNAMTSGIPVMWLRMEGSKEEGFEIDVDRYFAKPVRKDHFLYELKMLQSNGMAGQPVLVADNSSKTVKAFVQLMSAQGYDVAEAQTKDECLTRAKALKPGVIILGANFSEEHDLVRTLPKETGVDSMNFILLGEGR